MKIAVIGGGSTYTPELVNGFLSRTNELPVKELWLMDIDTTRLEIVGGFAQRMAAAKGSPFKVVLTTDQRLAVEGASYVSTQLRVGMMPARRADEYLGQRHGLVGQETTGVGGMAKALRTIPVILKIAEDMRQLAPGALLVNFTNPSGLVTQALSQYAADVFSVGVCNAPLTTKMHLLETLEKLLGKPAGSIAPERARLDTLGLNHLSWQRGFTLDGEDLWPQVIQAYVASLKSEANPEWTPEIIETLGMIPNYYLQYYYYTGRKLEEQNKWPPSRAEVVMGVEKELLRLYADPALQEPPPELMQRGGAYYSTVATQLINAHHNRLDEIHVVNVPHRGAVPGWPEDWVLEMPCRVGAPETASRIVPLPTQPLPLACQGLVSQIKAFEQLTIEAAVHGDRKAAYQALLAHPLGPAADQVQAVLDDLLETNRPYLPQFWK